MTDPMRRLRASNPVGDPLPPPPLDPRLEEVLGEREPQIPPDRRPDRRRFGLNRLWIAAAVVAIVSGATGAAALTSAPPERPTPADRERQPGTEQIGSAVRPTAGPPWAVMTYRSTSGKRCAVVGQNVDGQVGQVDGRDLRFRPYEPDGLPCTDLDDVHVSGFGAVAGGPVTLVWGIATNATTVRVQTRDSSREVSPGREGEWLVAYARRTEEAFKITVTNRDGTSSVRNVDAPAVRQPVFP